MKHIALISIIILGLFGCKTQQAKEISERDVAILAARCVNALQNKVDYGDEFHFGKSVGKLCKEFGMSSRVIPKSEFESNGLGSGEGMEHRIWGKDSLLIKITSGILFKEKQEVAGVDICIGNPERYGTIVPKIYKDAIYEEFRRQGWYSEYFEGWNFGGYNRKIRLKESEYIDGFIINITYDSTR